MDERVRTAIRMMHQSVGGHVSIRALSKSLNLSASRLRQLFKMETGRSPMQYLRELRMKNAEDLLRNTFLSIKEVAYVRGVNDVSSFVRDISNCGAVWIALDRKEHGEW